MSRAFTSLGVSFWLAAKDRGRRPRDHGCGHRRSRAAHVALVDRASAFVLEAGAAPGAAVETSDTPGATRSGLDTEYWFPARAEVRHRVVVSLRVRGLIQGPDGDEDGIVAGRSDAAIVGSARCQPRRRLSRRRPRASRARVQRIERGRQRVRGRQADVDDVDSARSETASRPARTLLSEVLPSSSATLTSSRRTPGATPWYLPSPR